MKAENRLASYGTLAPGGENHHQLDGVSGHWRKGVVRGRRMVADKGVWTGFPAFVPDENGDETEVQIFESSMLPDIWPKLDAFEGEMYRRTVTRAMIDGEEVEVSIYAFKASGVA